MVFAINTGCAVNYRMHKAVFPGHQKANADFFIKANVTSNNTARNHSTNCFVGFNWVPTFYIACTGN